MVLQSEKVVARIVTWLQEKMHEARTNRLAVDISGGVDSAVTAALCARAAGIDNVIGIYSNIHSSAESRRRAILVARTLGINLVQFDLDDVFASIVAKTEMAFRDLGLSFPDASDANRVIFGSLRSTLRAPIGRFTNRAFGGGLRVGTGNRDEDELTRFYQKGGDGEVDLNPIAGLFKGEVYELAVYLGIPAEIIHATPSPDLWGIGEAHADETELRDLTGVPLTYTRLGGPMGTIEWASRENATYGVITGEASELDSEELHKSYGYSDEQIAILLALRAMEQMTRHKAQVPPHLPREDLLASDVIC